MSQERVDEIKKKWLPVYLLMFAEMGPEKSVPSGHIYAQLMDKVDLDTHNFIIRLLEMGKFVKQDPSFLITWVGPEATRQEILSIVKDAKDKLAAEKGEAE